MSIKLASAIAILAAIASAPGLAQQQQSNAPKASKADVQKVVNAIKADPAKMAAYCQSAKLDEQVSSISEKNQNDPKLQSLEKEIADLNKKVGPEFEKVIYSEMDDASGALLEDLSKSCK